VIAACRAAIWVRPRTDRILNLGSDQKLADSPTREDPPEVSLVSEQREAASTEGGARLPCTPSASQAGSAEPCSLDWRHSLAPSLVLRLSAARDEYMALISKSSTRIAAHT
jgi:hypothetical protein